MNPALTRRRFISTLASCAAASAWAEPSVPTLSGPTLDGRSYSLQQDQGKVVLVFFWSTTCAVCRDGLPELRLNYEGWRDRGFQLVAVSTDPSLRDLQMYERLVQRTVTLSQKFPQLWRGDPAYRDSFGPVPHTPTSILFDREGRKVRQVQGRMDPSMWDDIAALVAN